MSVHPYVPGTPTVATCADCSNVLYFDGCCPNPACPRNTPTEPVSVDDVMNLITRPIFIACPAGWIDCPLCAEDAKQS